MSHFSTINLVDNLGKGFDMTVKEWKELAEKKMIEVTLSATILH